MQIWPLAQPMHGHENEWPFISGHMYFSSIYVSGIPVVQGFDTELTNGARPPTHNAGSYLVIKAIYEAATGLRRDVGVYRNTQAVAVQAGANSSRP